MGETMRRDMFHAIMNGGCGCTNDRYRHRRSKNKRVDEDLPKRESFGKNPDSSWDRHSHYSLKPLWGWLNKQVGKPWAKVSGEIYRAFRGRDIPFTIADSIGWYVETVVFIDKDDGSPYTIGYGHRSKIPAGKLYVCPKTKRLLRVKNPRKGSKPIIIPAEKLVKIDEKWKAIKRDGIWWKVQLQDLDDPNVKDAFLGNLRNISYQELERMYGVRGFYCSEKRQLSHRDMKKYGLYK